MMSLGAAVVLTSTLLAAQGSHAAPKHRKSTGSSHLAPAPTTAERRVQAPVRAQPAPAPGGKRTETGTALTDSDAANGGEGAAVPTTTKAAKTKVYTFGAMDVEGKLKTPQLLYFLNRIKLELEMSAPDHRSFMKELERTADDPSL
ncbi:MAG TPA: hypothetical protein VGP07_18900 [Polyangia bacterium]|jgi:hypothetical protein